MSFDPDSLYSALLSDAGRVRSENQDACGEFRGNAGVRLIVVADGMGGHLGGATASRLAIETLGARIAAADAADGLLLERALEDANARVHGESEANAELRGMGTTCVALLFAPGNAWVAHVGDSRAYRWRDGRLERLTRDHSVVAELVDRGEIMPEEADTHPRRNEILRSIGASPDVKVDVKPIDVLPGDRYLICSDGLSGVVSDPEIGAVLAAEPPDRAVRLLVDAANDRGGPDNVTVAITEIPDPARRATFAGTRPSASAALDDLRQFERELSEAASRRRFRSIAMAATLVAILLAICLLVMVAGATRTEVRAVSSSPPEQQDPETSPPPR